MTDSSTDRSALSEGAYRIGVAICTVTHNSAADLPAYFGALQDLETTGIDVRIVIVDCASQDESLDVLQSHRERDRQDPQLPGPLEIIELDQNRGFAGGMNAAITAAQEARYVLLLNPDARPEPEAVVTLVETTETLRSSGLRLGAVTPRLVRPDGETLDACGMHLAVSWRHFDRGSDESEAGRYTERCEVFGGTGAATLFARECLEDTAVSGEVFDESFHSFREDAELAFRLQERGWRVVYEPAAVFEHRRSNLPRTRRHMTAEINFHTLKNRFLLRSYHQTAATRALTAIPTLVRDLGILGYVLLRERSSLRAFSWLWRQRHRIRERRRIIQGRRTTPGSAVCGWFMRHSRPLP